jgi:FMN reductase
MSTRRIAVVAAGLGRPSSTRLLADRLAGAAADGLRLRGFTPETEVVELRDHAHDITNNLLTGFPPTSLRAVVDTVAGADALIAVTPTFNASYSGLFKSFFDVLEEGALAGKPVLMGATGGTARHSLVLEHAMRPMFAYLRAVPVPTGVYAASEDWGAAGGADPLTPRVERAAGELAEAVAARPVSAVHDPYEDPVPFTDLLRGA